MPQNLVPNVIDPARARYIPLREDLERLLREEYGEGIEFKIEHINDRWSFQAPELVSKKKIKSVVCYSYKALGREIDDFALGYREWISTIGGHNKEEMVV
ncbi:MAG: hypothetical protein M1813_001331 [Trichoglossum hirsutum]|nr:MAG: hypothetical protein M1813_001331 [Trichoglossum hirsutum]